MATIGSKAPPTSARNAAAWREAVLLGAAGGMRTFAPVAALTARGRIVRNTPGRYAVMALAAGELAGDKHPGVPNRIEPQGLAGRLVSSAIGGGVAAGAPGAGVAAATAGASALGSFHARRALGRRTSIPEPVLGVLEDLLTGVVAAAATRRRTPQAADPEPAPAQADGTAAADGAAAEDTRPWPVGATTVPEPTRPTPLEAVGRGLVAGALGTAAMSAAQAVYYEATDKEISVAPGEVGRRIIEGVFQRKVPRSQEDRLNWGMHVAYGTSLGIPFGLVAGSAAPRPGLLKAGLGFAAGAWGAGLVVLPAMKLSPPLWKLPPSSIASEVGFHLVYGLAGSVAYRALP